MAIFFFSLSPQVVFVPFSGSLWTSMMNVVRAFGLESVKRSFSISCSLSLYEQSPFWGSTKISLPLSFNRNHFSLSLSPSLLLNILLQFEKPWKWRNFGNQTKIFNCCKSFWRQKVPNARCSESQSFIVWSSNKWLRIKRLYWTLRIVFFIFLLKRLTSIFKSLFITLKLYGHFNDSSSVGIHIRNSF